MKFRKDERGQVLVITAVFMVGFLGLLGFAVDVGILFHTRWQLQVAADAAATAAAVEYLHNGYNSATAITAGSAAATANDVNDGNTMTASVTVNANASSPAAHKGCSGSTCYFEAIVSKPNPTIFFRAFYSLWNNTSGNTTTVSARAVAGTPGNSTNCITLAGPSGNDFDANGNYQINATGCSLYVNSSSTNAMTGKGNSGSINTASVLATGPTSAYTANFSSSTVVTGNVIPQSIPFSDITPPATGTCSAPSGGKITASTPPGCYSGNVTIGGGATLAAGTYTFTGNVTINGSFTAHNVAFYIDGGSLTVKPGNATIDWTAPTGSTDPFNGICVYQPATDTNQIGMQAGSATGNITGYIVAPGAQFQMQDHGGALTLGGLVVGSIDNGPAVLNITGYNVSSSPLKYIALVE